MRTRFRVKKKPRMYTMLLEPRIRENLQSTRDRLLEQGSLLTQDTLDACYALFRRRFGPEVLAGLDGEELLHLMHLHGNRDSLVYWLCLLYTSPSPRDS